MNHKPQSVLRLGGVVLVLVAFIMLSHQALAAPQPAPTTLSNLNQDCKQPTNSTIPLWTCPIRVGPFTKSTSNPVISPGIGPAWDDAEVYSPSVVYVSSYQMWYTGFSLSSGSAIGYATGIPTSPTSITWTKYASNPVLNKGDPGSWDVQNVAFPNVIYDGVYKMWYSGTGGNIRKIGYATSPDGITWTKSLSNPVLSPGNPGTWDASQVSNPMVYKIGSTYHMWYSSGLTLTGGIGHATSADGIVWVKDPANPVISSGGSNWDAIVIAPSVSHDNCLFQMLYTGCNSSGEECQIGYARSADGTVWQKLGIVIPLGSSGAFDAGLTGYPSIMIGEPYVRLWYTGEDASGYKRIGFSIAMNLDKKFFLPVTNK